MPGKNLAVRADRKKAEKVRRKLVEAGIFDKSRQISRDDESVLFPVTKRPAAKLKLRTVQASLPIQQSQSQSLARSLAGVLPAGSFSKSFDIVGTVGILDVPGLSPEQQEFAAESLRKIYPALTAVATRAGNIEDEFRVRPLRLIWGKTTETIHSENGIKLKLDPAKVYFSARQAAERARISSLVGKGERILVMFAGAGPYSILLAKSHPDCQVVSVELNPAGASYLAENIKLNKVGANSEAICGDVRKAVPRLGKFDRIVMPLPKNAGDFLDIAAAAAAPGATIHFYSFGRDFAEAEQPIAGKLPGARILNRQKCGDIAPGKCRLVFDIKPL